MKDVCKNVLGLATFRINYTQHCSSQWIKGLRLAASEEGELSGKAVGWRSYGGTFHACRQGLDMGCDRDLRRCESTSCKQGTQRTQSHTSKKRPRSSKATEDICAGKAMWTPSLTTPSKDSMQNNKWEEGEASHRCFETSKCGLPNSQEWKQLFLSFVNQLDYLKDRLRQ